MTLSDMSDMRIIKLTFCDILIIAGEESNYRDCVTVLGHNIVLVMWKSTHI